MESKLSGMNALALSIFEINKEKGFWDKERNIGEMLMLVTSELGEAMEAHRKGKFANWENFEKDKTIAGENSAFQNHIKDSFEDEIADAIIRLLDMSAGLGINLEKQIEAKIYYNKTREKLHGKKY
jgi:NTP pyrophosphatase (non-canonical NTP hydrolase)